MEKEIEKVLNELETKYKMLISDWIPIDDGRMKREIDENKRSLFRSAILEAIDKIQNEERN